jgi:hypothetical protein
LSIKGSNSVSRQFERKNVAVLVIFRESHNCLQSHLVEAAIIQHVPILVLPKCSDEFAQLLKFKRMSCFAVPCRPLRPSSVPLSSSSSSAPTSAPIADEVKDMQSAAEGSRKPSVDPDEVTVASMDELRDALISFATSQ